MITTMILSFSNQKIYSDENLGTENINLARKQQTPKMSISLRKLNHAIYRDFFSVGKIEDLIRKILIFFFIFLLKT